MGTKPAKVGSLAPGVLKCGAAVARLSPLLNITASVNCFIVVSRVVLLCVLTRLLSAWAAPSLAVRQAIHCATELHGTRFRFRVRGQGVQEREQVRRHRGTVAYWQDKAEIRALQ